jgi:hypothetical protein
VRRGEAEGEEVRRGVRHLDRPEDLDPEEANERRGDGEYEDGSGPMSRSKSRLSRSDSDEGRARSAKNVKTMVGEVVMYSNNAVASDGWGGLRYGRSSWTRSKDGVSPSCVRDLGPSVQGHAQNA